MPQRIEPQSLDIMTGNGCKAPGNGNLPVKWRDPKRTSGALACLSGARSSVALHSAKSGIHMRDGPVTFRSLSAGNGWKLREIFACGPS